jgi:hypothetical protein
MKYHASRAAVEVNLEIPRNGEDEKRPAPHLQDRPIFLAVNPIS